MSFTNYFFFRVAASDKKRANLLLVRGKCNVDLCQCLYELGHKSLADLVKQVLGARCIIRSL